jgi:hypothetical protein
MVLEEFYYNFMLIQNEIQCGLTATMGCVTVAYLFRSGRGGYKNMDQCENPSFYARFINLYLKN